MNAQPKRFIHWRIAVFLCFTLAVSACVFFLPRIPQDPEYHLFADNSPAYSIPNFWNILSNVPFLIVGLWGLIRTVPRPQTSAFSDACERWPYVLFFLGIALTCFGSALYHLSPGNRTLLWDRLPMAVAFMGIFSGTIGDRIDPRLGTLCLGPMLLAGIGSVIYWYLSELNFSGDLRPYILVQFFTIGAILLLLALFPARYTHAGWVIGCGFMYTAAKVFEMLDRQLFDMLKISGHTLKHLAASLAAVCIVVMLRRRTYLGSEDTRKAS